MRNKKYYAAAIAAIALMVSCATEPENNVDAEMERLNKQAGAAVASATADLASSVPTIVPSATPEKTTPPPVVPSLLEEGSWQIGKKTSIESGVISAGTYVITTKADAYGCYYARVKNFDGELDSIITNDNISPGATKRVVVKSTDGGLELGAGCIATKQLKK